MKKLALILCLLASLSLSAFAAQPVVAIHVSEVTQALESTIAGPSTPSGEGTTGKEWWTPWWHYFIMSDSVKEAMRSDGTPFVVVSDADISAGNLLNSDGTPKYPIVVSLASEAIRDDEVTPLLNYVSAGGFLLVGSSSFTRNPDGTTRGDFAVAAQLGLHMANANLQNWYQATSFTKATDHRLVSHIPDGTLTWHMPLASEDSAYNAWGDPAPPNHYIWQVAASTANVVGTGDNGHPYLATTQYGQGYFIYDAAMQPLIGHGGFGPGMYAYGIFRNAIEWAFESANAPIVRLSPWPYPYNAAYIVRHDFENYQDAINSIEASAQSENSVGAKGDYYFCTGTLRVEMGNAPATVSSLRRAVSLYGATIGSHNGGLSNPYRSGLQVSDYDYWHWGPDLALDSTPPGYANGSAYASTSIVNSFNDLNGWLSGLNTNTRTWVSPYFNATREGSYQILDQVGAITAGEQKLSPFPHWTISTQTQGKRYRFVTLPPSEWYIGSDVAQALNWGHTTSTIDDLVDYYYDLGALINLYMHEPSTTGLASEYIRHSASKTAIWPANAVSIYNWWNKRSSIQMIPVYTMAGNRLVVTAGISGANDPDSAIEFAIPNWIFASTGIQVKLNGVAADPSSYRTYHQGIKVKVGSTVSSVEVSYPLTAGPTAQDDSYSVVTGNTLNVPAPGVLGNDTNSGGGTLTAVVAAQPSHGTLTLNSNGSFTYTPTARFVGTDVFSYVASNGKSQSGAAIVTITVLAVWAPVALNDAYSVLQASTLNVPAPGVLSNDTAGAAGSVAVPVGQPVHGTVSLQADGSFTYIPTASFTGTDVFTYQQSVGGVLSNIATVTITVNPAGVLFSDNFSGAPGPDPLWVTALGTWNVANGVMNGSSPSWNYGFAYTTGSWTDYSVQGQIQFPAGAFGGGIGGRVNGATGAHYGAWIYPEGSSGGSAVLKLVKFHDWTTWSYIPMAQATLPGVGTVWHTLLLTFQGNRIRVSYDGTQYIDITDTGFDSLAAYTAGSVSLDMWTESTAYLMNIDNIVVQTLTTTPVAQNDTYSVGQGATLTVSAPGVLANDTGGGSGSTATLVTPTTHGSLNLQPDGSFTYTPTAGFSGSDSFTYQASVGGLTSNTATVTIVVALPIVQSVTVNPGSVIGGTPSTGTVLLSGPAPTGGAVVTLMSDTPAVAAVPASVPVAAGTTAATFAITTVPVATNTSVMISGTYNSTIQAAQLVVTPPVLTALNLNPTSVMGGSSSTATVTLNGPAPTGGAVVTLTSSNTSAATVPASVTVAANATTATFTVSSKAVASNSSVTITATYAAIPRTASLTVTPAILNSVSLNPTSVRGGSSSTGTVTLNGPAPIGGAVVALVSSNTAVATVPNSVTVAANTTTATFTVSSKAVANNSPVTITATYGGTPRTATLTVTPATLSSVSLNPTSVRGGSSSTGTITLNGPAPTGGAVVTLTSSNTSAATVPASVTVAANATTATFTVSSEVVASNTSATITATYSGTSRTATLTVTATTLSSVSLNPTSVRGGSSSTGTVNLNGPAPTGGAVVTLTSSNTSAATVPTSVTVAGNATTATFTISSKVVSSNTSATITATYSGTSRTAILTVTAPALSSVSLSPSSVKGGNSSTGTVTLNGPAPAGGAVVALTNGNTSAATVPASVTVAANTTTATFTVTTKTVTSYTFVTISGTYNSPRRQVLLLVTP